MFMPWYVESWVLKVRGATIEYGALFIRLKAKMVRNSAYDGDKIFIYSLTKPSAYVNRPSSSARFTEGVLLVCGGW